MLLEQATLDQLLDTAIAEEFHGDAHRLSPRQVGDVWGKGRGLVAALEGTWPIRGTRVRIGVGLSERFPAELPHVFLLSHHEIDPIPHVDENDLVCCFDGEGLVIDRHRPADLLRETLIQARKTIERGLANENKVELFDECEAYWSVGDDAQSVLCNVEPTDLLRKISVYQREYTAVGDDLSAFEEISGRFHGKQPSVSSGLYVPLDRSVIGTTFHPWDIDSVRAVRGLIRKHVSPENQARLKAEQRVRGKRTFVVLGIPKPAGGRALLGLWLREIKSRHPLLDDEAEGRVERVHLRRSDREVVRQRSTSTQLLREAAIVLVGCGALGGHLAGCLAWAGVGGLTLVDPDVVQPENTFRHVLGRGGVLAPSKVVALKQELDLKVPGIKVRAVQSRIEEALKRESIALKDCSLIVVTVGSPTVSLLLNEMLFARPDAPPIIFTWLEPYGIGGHALLTNARSQGIEGCYECLFRSSEHGLINTADFSAPCQSFGRRELGCANTFTPYGDLDARETAILASRLTLDALHGRAHGHPLRSWRGDATDFRIAGFQTSLRYELDEKELRESGRTYVREDCLVCRSRPT